MWRGLWEGYDYWAGVDLTQSAVSTVLVLAILSSSFSLRSVQSSPMGVNVDSRTFLQTGGGDVWGRRLFSVAQLLPPFTPPKELLPPFTPPKAELRQGSKTHFESRQD